MAALTRTTHKVFGATGSTANFGQFGSAKTGVPVTTRNIASIMALAAWGAEGWKDAVDPLSPAPALEEMNSIFYAHSYQVGYMFQSGIPEWDAATTYYTGSVVRVGEEWFTSLVDNNVGNTTPVSASDANWKWANQPGLVAGVILDFGGISAPAGYLLCDNATVSRVTYASLFAALTVVKSVGITNGSPIVTGVDTTTGLGAGMAVEGTGIPAGTKILTVDGPTQVTLNANCTSSITTTMRIGPWGLGDGATTFNVPDFRKKMSYGAGSGAVAGQTGGAETVTLDATQIPAHTHSLANTFSTADGGAGGPYSHVVNAPSVTGSTGGGLAHDNMPPYAVATKIIKY